MEVPVPNDIEVNRLTGPLHGVKPYRHGRVVCFRCGKVRECIAYGSSDQYFDAWRESWQGLSSAVGGSRSSLQPGSFGAELYDYLVRHDQDEGLTAREITDGLVERDSAAVNSGLYHLYLVTGQRRTPQRYRAVPIPPEE